MNPLLLLGLVGAGVYVATRRNYTVTALPPSGERFGLPSGKGAFAGQNGSTPQTFTEAGDRAAEILGEQSCRALGITDPEALRLCALGGVTNPIGAQVALAGRVVDWGYNKLKSWT